MCYALCQKGRSPADPSPGFRGWRTGFADRRAINALQDITPWVFYRHSLNFSIPQRVRPTCTTIGTAPAGLDGPKICNLGLHKRQNGRIMKPV